MIIKRQLALPRQRLLIIMTSIIMTSIFIIEALIAVMRVLLPPLPAMAESFLNALFLSIAVILTLYLFLFRSWVRDTTKRGPRRNSMVTRSNSPQQQNQQQVPLSVPIAGEISISGIRPRQQ
ncbi:hypothetical protein ACFLXG_04080 [Chloroflexota bacterium]